MKISNASHIYERNIFSPVTNIHIHIFTSHQFPLNKEKRLSNDEKYAKCGNTKYNVCWNTFYSLVFYAFYLLYIEWEIRSLRRSNQINKNERKKKRNKVFRYYGFIVFTAQKQGSKLFACFLRECGTEEKIIYNSELIYLFGIRSFIYLKICLTNKKIFFLYLSHNLMFGEIKKISPCVVSINFMLTLFIWFNFVKQWWHHI